MIQKVYINNEDKLIIETDNCCIDAENNLTTELKGKFEIEADDLARIAAVLNDTTFAPIIRLFDSTVGYKLITNDEALNEMNTFLKDKDNCIHELSVENCRLLELIDNHNKKCIFKFRKINYDKNSNKRTSNKR